RGVGSESQAFAHAAPSFGDPTGCDAEVIGDLGKGLPRSEDLTGIIQSVPEDSKIIGIAGVTEDQTNDIAKELLRIKSSLCYKLIFRHCANQDAFKQAFEKCDILIVVAHGDPSATATAPGVLFPGWDDSNKDIVVDAKSPLSHYAQASCGSAFYAESFSK